MSQSAEIGDALQRAQRAYQDGRMQVVEEECRQLIERHPDTAEAWVLMGAVARHHGYLEDAAGMMRRAVQLKPENRHMRFVLGTIYMQQRDWRNARAIFEPLNDRHPDPRHENALAKCDWGMGRYERALERFAKAAREEPNEAALQVSLAQALISLWRRDEAREVLAPLIRAQTPHAMVWLLQARLAFRDGEYSECLALAERAASCPDASAEAHLNHAALLKLAGRGEAAADVRRQVPANPRYDAQWDSFEYALSHRPPARLLGFGDQVLEHCLDAAKVKGLTLEFGVFHGRSLRLIAERVRADVHGFDSFRGLPEDWSPAEPAGSYSTDGRRPEVPRHVRLHEGWFEDSLPAFLDRHDGPVRLAHIDCDIYSSTRTVLEHLRPRLRPGSVLVFDDYLAYAGWREHEYRAFREFARESAVDYRYLAFGLLGRAAAVEITGTGE